MFELINKQVSKRYLFGLAENSSCTALVVYFAYYVTLSVLHNLSFWTLLLVSASSSSSIISLISCIMMKLLKCLRSIRHPKNMFVQMNSILTLIELHLRAYLFCFYLVSYIIDFSYSYWLFLPVCNRNFNIIGASCIHSMAGKKILMVDAQMLLKQEASWSILNLFAHSFFWPKWKI